MPAAFISSAALQNVTWLPASTCPYTDTLAVFRLPLAGGESHDTYLRSLLQPDEAERAGRYHQAADRQRFTYARSGVRLLAGAYLNRPPGEIRFVAGVNQKPELLNGAGWHVNVSHAGDWILLAIGRIPVGIDVERINPDFFIDEVFLWSSSPDEQRLIQASTGTDARLLFYTLWTRREALAKATGKGLDDDFNQIPASDGQHPTDSRLIGADGPWTVRSFAVADDYAAAVAYGSESVATAFYTLDGAFFRKEISTVSSQPSG